ncbi:MAG: PilZ domain-containing protein, partial [Nitrospiraceae bacterium]
MDKRAFERIPVLLYAQLYCDDSFYDALVLNLSQNGIYFSAEARLSCGLDLYLSIPMESNELRVPFKIIRSSEKGFLYSRFGAELLSPSPHYLTILKSHKTSMYQKNSF